MNRQLLVSLLMVILIFGGCSSEDSSYPELKSQIHALNEEVIKYIDRLEEREETIQELEAELEAKDQMIADLNGKIEQQADQITTLNDEIAQTVLEKEEFINHEKSENDPPKDVSTQTIDGDLTSVLIKDNVLKLGDTEEQVPYDDLVIINETEEKRTQGNKGTLYFKTLATESIRIQMEGDEEGKYVISQIEILRSVYPLSAGLKVGSSVVMLENYLATTSLNVKTYQDSVLEIYEVEIDSSRSVIFRIDQQKIENIILTKKTP